MPSTGPSTPGSGALTPTSSTAGESLSFSTSSIIDHPSTPSHDSALSSVSSDSSYDSDSDSDSDAEAEWQESLQQLELLMSLVVIPFFGKWVGRKCAYWAWAKFMTWNYPDIEVVVTNRKAFNVAGVFGVASTSGAPL